MKTALIGFKTTPQIKIQAQELTEELGISLSAVLNGLLKQFIAHRRLELFAEPKPSQYALDMLKESEEDFKSGRVSPNFDNAKDAIAWLNDKNRKYAN